MCNIWILLALLPQQGVAQPQALDVLPSERFEVFENLVAQPDRSNTLRSCWQRLQGLSGFSENPSSFGVQGLAFLRLNRNLYSLLATIETEAQWRAWLQRSGDLAFANFPAEQRKAFNSCASELRSALPITARNYIVDHAQLPNLYQAVPLLPKLMEPFLRRSIQSELAQHHSREKSWRGVGNPIHHGALSKAQIYGELGAYPAAAVKSLVTKADRDALGLPRFLDAEKTSLLRWHQPLWALYSSAENDIPGTVQLAEMQAGKFAPSLSSEPSVYSFLSYGRWQSEATVQLNYVVWFTERKAEKSFDLLSGRWDGIHWRVHLNLSGQVIAYDAIHNCGCWYQFYPGPAMKVSPPRDEEPYYRSDFWPGSWPPLIVLEPNTHSIESVLPTGSAALPILARYKVQAMTHRPYESLLTGALFDRTGVLASSSRSERWLLWPLGIKSPGAMRVAGRHPVAFISQRIFSDPDLLSKLGARPIASD